MKTHSLSNQTFYTVQKILLHSIMSLTDEHPASNDRKITTSRIKPFYYCTALVQIHIPLFSQGQTKQNCFNFKKLSPSYIQRQLSHFLF